MTCPKTEVALRREAGAGSSSSGPLSMKTRVQRRYHNGSDRERTSRAGDTDRTATTALTRSSFSSEQAAGSRTTRDPQAARTSVRWSTAAVPTWRWRLTSLPLGKFGIFSFQPGFDLLDTVCRYRSMIARSDRVKERRPPSRMGGVVLEELDPAPLSNLQKHESSAADVAVPEERMNHHMSAPLKR